jgi:hypothetical protein
MVVMKQICHFERSVAMTANVIGIKVVIEKSLKHDCPNMLNFSLEVTLLELAQLLFSIITFNPLL